MTSGLVKLLCIFLFLGTIVIAVPVNAKDNGRNIQEIQLKVHAPFSVTILTINKQGLMAYEAKSPDTGIDAINDSLQLTSEQYHELVGLITRDVFALKDNYSEPNRTDATVYTIIIKQVGQDIKAVTCYGHCPEQILKIREKIKQLWGKEILEVGV